MERNKPSSKKKEKSYIAAKDNNNEYEEQLGISVFNYNELVLVIFSHLLIPDLVNVSSVSKKFNLLAKEPTIWKSIFLNHFGLEYRSIIKDVSGADLMRAAQDPEFARQVMNYKLVAEVEWQTDLFAVPKLSTKEAIINYIFNAKPVWRSPLFRNDRTGTAGELLMLPHFQPNPLPIFDSLFMHIFFSHYNEPNIFTPIELLNILIERANGNDPDARTKAISLLCQWIANYGFMKHQEQLEAPLKLFLDTSKDHEISRINHAQYLATLPKEFDWHAHDEKIRAKMNEKQLKQLKCNVKSKLLVEPIDLFAIPPEEMAKQVALAEQGLLRELKYDHFVRNEWRNGRIIRIFNARTNGIIALILTQPSKQKRFQAYAFFVRLGAELVKIRCMSAAMIICAALNNSALFRLLTPKEVIKKYPKEFNELNDATTSAAGYRNLRELMKGYDRTTVPYLGIIYSNMVFIDEGNPTVIENKINWTKFLRFFTEISNALNYQFNPYLYDVVPSLQNAWNSIESDQTENIFYEYSTRILPRGASKENDSPFK